MTVLARPPRPGALTGLCVPHALLCHPFLALGPQRAPIDYRGREHGTSFFIRVESMDANSTLATLMDGDVLTVFTTKLVHRLNLDEPLDLPLILTPGTILRALSRDVGGRQHGLLRRQIQRLSTTHVATDLGGTYRSFPWIEDVSDVRHEGRAALRFVLPPFFAEEVERRRFLRIDPAALKLRGLERRLYGWGRAYVGRDAPRDWIVDLWHARERAASRDAPRRFWAAIDEIVARNRLPAYALSRIDHQGLSCLQLTARRPTVTSGDPTPITDTAFVEELVL